MTRTNLLKTRRRKERATLILVRIPEYDVNGDFVGYEFRAEKPDGTLLHIVRDSADADWLLEICAEKLFDTPSQAPATPP